MIKGVCFGIYGANKSERGQAEYYTCDYTDNCQHYKNGKCVCQKLIFGAIKCPHATYHHELGYTERALKYASWKNELKRKYQPEVVTDNNKLCKCGDYIYLPYPHLEVWGDKVDNALINDHFIKSEMFAPEMIRKIISHRPRALMGGEITDFQAKQVPKFVQHLKEEMPEKYKEFATAYPDIASKYNDTAKNCIGRNAYISTMPQGAEIKDCHSNVWEIIDDEIVCHHWKTWLPFGSKATKVRIKITSDMTCQIKNASQVDESTKYKD
jgi:hypothetical protein